MPPRQLLPRTQKRSRSSRRNLAKGKEGSKSVESSLKATCSNSMLNDVTANVERGDASREDHPYSLCLKNGGKLIIKAEVHSPPRFDLEDAGERFENDNSKAFGPISVVYPNPTVVLHAGALSFLTGDDWPEVVSGAIRESSKVPVVGSEDRERSGGKCGDSISEKNKRRSGKCGDSISEKNKRRSGKCGDSISKKNIPPVVLNEVGSKRSVENKAENHTVLPTETDDIIHNSNEWTPGPPAYKSAVDEDIFGGGNSLVNYLPMLKSALLTISAVSSTNPHNNAIQEASSTGETPFKGPAVSGKRKIVDEVCTPAGKKHINECSVDASTGNKIRDGLTGDKCRSTVRKRPKVSSQRNDPFSTLEPNETKNLSFSADGEEESVIFSSLAEANIPGNEKVLDWMMSSAKHMRQDCQGFPCGNKDWQDTNYPSVTQSKPETELAPKAHAMKRRKLDSSKKLGSRNCNRDFIAIVPGPSVHLSKERGHSDESGSDLQPISPNPLLFETENEEIEVKLNGQNDTDTRKPTLNDSSIIRSKQVCANIPDTAEIASFKCYVGPKKKCPSKNNSNKREVTDVDPKSEARPVALVNEDKLKQLPKMASVDTLEPSIISSPELMKETEQTESDPPETNLLDEKCSGVKDGNCSYQSGTEDGCNKDYTVAAPLTSGLKLKIVRNRKRDVGSYKQEVLCVNDNFDQRNRVCKYQSNSSISIQTDESDKQNCDHDPVSGGNQAEPVAIAAQISPHITNVFTLKEETRSKLQKLNENADAILGSVRSPLVLSHRPELGCGSLARISMATYPRTEINHTCASQEKTLSSIKQMTNRLISPHLEVGRGPETNNCTKINAINSVTSFYSRANMETVIDEPLPTVRARKETHKSQEEGSLPPQTDNSGAQYIQECAVWLGNIQNHEKFVCNFHATQSITEREMAFGERVLSDEVQSYSSLGSHEMESLKEKIGAACSQSPPPHHQHLKTTQSPALPQSQQETEPQKMHDEEKIDQERDNSEEKSPTLLQDDEPVEETVLEQGAASLSNKLHSNVDSAVITPVAVGKVPHASIKDEEKESCNLNIQQPSLFMIESNNVAKCSLFGDGSTSPHRGVLPTSTVLLQNHLPNTKPCKVHSSTHSSRILSSSRFSLFESNQKNKTQNFAAEKRDFFTSWRNASNAAMINTRGKESDTLSTSVAPRPDHHKTTLREAVMPCGLANVNAASKCVSFGDSFSKFTNKNTSLQQCSSGAHSTDNEVPRFYSVPSTRECSFNTGARDLDDTLSISGMSLDDETGKKPVPSTPVRPSKLGQLRCSNSNNSFSHAYQRQLDILHTGNGYNTKSQCFIRQFGQLSGNCPPSRPVPLHKPTFNNFSETLGDGPNEVIRRNGIEYQVITAKLLVPQYNPLQYLNQVPPQPLLLTARQQRASGPGAWVKGVDRSLESFEHYDVHALG